jgi:hypothetical protein
MSSSTAEPLRKILRMVTATRTVSPARDAATSAAASVLRTLSASLIARKIQRVGAARKDRVAGPKTDLNLESFGQNPRKRKSGRKSYIPVLNMNKCGNIVKLLG